MSVIEAVMAFDGKHVDELKSAARVFSQDEGPALIELCSSDVDNHRVAATWIIKAVLEAGGGTSLDLHTYFSRLEVEADHDALLHLLQSVQHMPGAGRTHRNAISQLLGHRKTLVSVWALDALVRIALQTGEGLEGARQRVDAALGHEKASMRARARHLAVLLGL